MPKLDLLNKVKLHLRIDGSGDDALLASLISAGKQYLSNAGVHEPETDGGTNDGQLSLYELAVTLYASIMFDGDEKDKLSRAMTAIILQIKDYRLGGEDT